MTPDALRAIALLCGFLASMGWGAHKSLYPDPPKPPKGGKRKRAPCPIRR